MIFFSESGAMKTPVVKFLNSTEVKVEWDGHAFHVGGPVYRYETKITHLYLNETHIIHADPDAKNIEVNLEEMVTSQGWAPDCFNHSNRNIYGFSTRAVTFDPKSTKYYYGDWSIERNEPALCESEFIFVKLK